MPINTKSIRAAHLKQGEQAEAACYRYLKSQGLKLITKNFSCRFGEIDIIMLEKKILVFIEVRYRKNDSFGGALESVTPAKQQKLRKTAELYLQQNKQYENARFDVVAVSKNNETNLHKVQYNFDWITNAF